MVLVDRFASSPKLLVVPKDSIMFPVDASAMLIGHLAIVAAAASDAMIGGASRPCDSTTVSRVYINPPCALSVRQLHIHVEPKTKINTQDQVEFYSEVGRRLTELLRKP
jgi:hypothetical protein